MPLLRIAQQVDDATRRQYDEILEREHRGGRISQQERALLMSVYPKLNPPRSRISEKIYTKARRRPVSRGQNTIPPEHLQTGMEISNSVVPPEAEGHPAANGKIALLSIGVSNTTTECQTFITQAAEDKELNPRLVLVDGA